jgi:acetyltransferase-like isoleucine patch superfamily enzyme
MKRWLKIVAYIPLIQWLRWVQHVIKIYIKYPNVELCNHSWAYDCCFLGFNKIYENCYLSKVEVGKHTYIARDCLVHNSKIGAFCSIGNNVTIAPGAHPVNEFPSTHPVFYSTKKQNGTSFATTQQFIEMKEVVIGNDVWIGSHCVIIDGITIGDGAIIAAGAVVVSDVLPYSVVGGVPAKHIKYRFDETIVSKLLTEKWWEKY